MTRIMRTLDTQAVVEPQSMVTNFRGRVGIVTYASRANDGHRDGLVIVDNREYYARVWGLRVEESSGE